MGFNCYLGEYILVLVIFFWGGGILAQEWGMVIWLSPINCNFVIQLSCTTAQCEHSLNVSKSSFIIFHPPQKKLQQIPIQINSENIREKNSTKYLCVIMDKHLNKERTYSLKINWTVVKGYTLCTTKVTKDNLFCLLAASLNIALICGLYLSISVQVTHIQTRYLKYIRFKLR